MVLWPFVWPMLARSTLAAVDGAGEVVGGAVLRTFRAGGYRWGVVFWIFAEPAKHGEGVGKALLQAAIAWFSRRGCQRVVASVDGYNSRSWNLFYGYGFRYWPLACQLRELRLAWPALAWGTFHLLDAGNFLLRYPPEAAAPGPDARPAAARVLEVAVSLVATGLALLLALWRQGAFGGAAAMARWQLTGSALAAAAVYGGVALGAQAWQARRLGLSVEFRVWDSGAVLAGLFAALFGVFLPAPGGFYVRHATFRYTELEARSALGRMALAAAIGVLALYVACTAARYGPELLQAAGVAGRAAGFGYGLFGVALVFPPFQAMPAAHLFRWNRPAWAACAAAFAAATGLG